MAISSIKNTSAFVLTYKVGVDENNKDIFVSQKFPKINKQATDEAIHTVGRAMETLLNYPLHDLRKVDDFSIVEA